MNINTLTLAGRLTRDVTVKEVGRNNTPVALIGVAVNRRVKRKDEWVDEPVYVDVQLWGKRGEAFARYHSKGDPCCFPEAELVFEQWEKDGEKRSKLFVQAKSFEFVPKADKKPAGQVGTTRLEDEDVPF